MYAYIYVNIMTSQFVDVKLSVSLLKYNFVVLTVNYLRYCFHSMDKTLVSISVLKILC